MSPMRELECLRRLEMALGKMLAEGDPGHLSGAYDLVRRTREDLRVSVENRLRPKSRRKRTADLEAR